MLSVLFTGGAVLGYFSYGRWVNPITVLSGSWAVVSIAYFTAGASIYPLQSQVATLVILGTASIALGAGVSSLLFRSKTDQSLNARPAFYFSFDEKRIIRWHFLLCSTYFLYVALQLARVYPLLSQAGGLREIFLGSAGLDFRRAYLSQRINDMQTSFGSGGLLYALVGYLLFVGICSIFTGALLASRSKYIIAFIPLAISGVYGIIILERASFLYSAAIFAFSWYYFARLLHPQRDHDGRKQISKLAILGFVSLIAVIVVLPIALRQTGGGDKDTQSGPVAYLYSGIAGLNGLYLADSTLAGAYTGRSSPVPVAAPEEIIGVGEGHGAWTFRGIAGIAARLGFDVPVPPSSLYFVKTGDYDSEISNTYSYIIYFFYDGGYLGIVAFGLLFGALTQFFDMQVLRRGVAAAIAPAAIMLTTLAMSFFGLTLIRDFRYLYAAAVGFVILNTLMPAAERRDEPAQLNS